MYTLSLVLVQRQKIEKSSMIVVQQDAPGHEDNSQLKTIEYVYCHEVREERFQSPMPSRWHGVICQPAPHKLALMRST